MKVLHFRAFYNSRIVAQVIQGWVDDFVVYIGVITDEHVDHRPYEPEICGGGGQEIPHAARMSYKDARALFGGVMEDLEAKGLRWRN